MPASKEVKEFVTHVVELMQSIGPVSARSMFGGHGIFLEGIMFGLVADSVLYLKVDKETEGEFKSKGLEAFTYNKKGKEYKMSYYQAPEEVLEDSEVELKRLYVQPNYQGRSIRKRLFHTAMSKANRIGYTSIVLDTLPTMQTAKSLYVAYGFKEIPAYYGNPVEGAEYYRYVFS